MRAEKASIVSDIAEKLTSSPFVLVTDYQGMKVNDFGELRNRLASAGAEMHVVKNNFMKRAMADSDLPEIAALNVLAYREFARYITPEAWETMSGNLSQPEKVAERGSTRWYSAMAESGMEA